MHMDEDPIDGTVIPAGGGYSFTCPIQTGHAYPGSYIWDRQPPPPDLPDVSDLASELRLDVTLPQIVASFGGTWVEYGVIEEQLASIDPDAFVSLVDRYGHTAIRETSYSASSFIAATLGRLSRRGDFAGRRATATGRWSYNRDVTWCATEPTQDWDNRLSWAATGKSMSYVPGNQEHAATI